MNLKAVALMITATSFIGTSSASAKGWSATKVVAASNASTDMKANADAVCTGTNDETCIQNVLDTLTTGGKLVLSEGTFNLSNALYIGHTSSTRENITIQGQGYGTVLNAQTNYPIAQTSGITIKRYAIRDLRIETTTNAGMNALTIRTALFSNFENISIKGGSSGTAIYIAPDSTTSVLRYTGNCAHNTFRNIDIEETYAGINLIGNIAGPDHIITLNRFENISIEGINGYGIIITSFADNNYFSNIHAYLSTNGSIGVLHNNSSTPAANVGVYANNFVNLSVDAFGLSNAIGIKFNWTKQNTVLGFYRSPEMDTENLNGNVLVKDAYSQSHYILNNAHRSASTPDNNWIETISKNVQAR